MIDIDFVILWVDGTDPKWQEECNRYRDSESRYEVARYRDWGTLKYWFRAVERYAPWVHKIFLVTCGQIPEGINLNHPKLEIVYHRDFIPEEYLPTFRSDTIEFNVHRIKGLSEHFVLFNDDMFINAPVSPEYYFKDGLPCDAAKEYPTYIPYCDPVQGWDTLINEFYNVGIINYLFDRRKVVSESPYRWAGPYLGPRGWIRSLLGYRKKYFVRFLTPHYEKAFLKRTFEDAWKRDYYHIHRSCSQKFRTENTVSIYHIRYWQLVNNWFYPKFYWPGSRRYYDITRDVELIRKALFSDKVKSLCINDTPWFEDEKYLEVREKIISAFDAKYPQRSEYEST